MKDIRITQYEALDGRITYSVRPMNGSITVQGELAQTVNFETVIKLIRKYFDLDVDKPTEV